MDDERSGLTTERRGFLCALASGATIVAAGCASPGAEHEGEEEEISPGEDLMREHGVLERVLLIYDETARRLEAEQPLQLELLARAAGIVRHFVEDYHERLEEEFLFPRFEAARRELELVRTLRAQHAKGRELTDALLPLAARGDAPSGEDRDRLVPILQAFTRMYRPHVAREDTVLFPAFRELLGGDAYLELGASFEEREHELFGHDGFEDVVQQVASVEQALDLYDLARFTPS